MLTVQQLYNYINEIMPFDTQENWDNSGININSGKSADKILTCLDVTNEAVDFAIKNKCGIILSHHPVIFSPINKINAEDIVCKIVKNQISVVSAHTNYDYYQCGTSYNFYKACRVDMQIKNYQFGVFGSLQEKTDFDTLLKTIKQNIATTIQYADACKDVKKVFFQAGSAKGMLQDILPLDCQCLITGEISYHDMLEFVHNGISVIAVGHNVSENFSITPLAQIIQENFKQIQAIPFTQEKLVQYI